MHFHLVQFWPINWDKDPLPSALPIAAARLSPTATTPPLRQKPLKLWALNTRHSRARFPREPAANLNQIGIFLPF
jgi:hypothetical protein